MSTTTTEQPQRTFFGHPLGLANLAGVEMWERFSFYGMQAILLYYLYFSLAQDGLGLPQTTATSIVGAYGGLVYLAPSSGPGWPTGCSGPNRCCSPRRAGHVRSHLARRAARAARRQVGLVLIAIGTGT